MGLLDRIENRLEGVVNGVFARGFKGEVEPAEIATKLQRQMDAEAMVLGRNKKLVPNDFLVGLSTHDYERIVPYTKAVNQEIVPELRAHATERSYVFNGPVQVSYELDESLPTGQFTVSSAAVAGVEPAQPATTTAIRRSRLVLEVNGVRHPLVPPGLTIGRGSQADLRINDPSVSRQHARIVVTGADDDLDIVIEDLGSTNGVVVNGVKVRRAALGDGSRIEIGSTRMLVHAPVGA